MKLYKVNYHPGEADSWIHPTTAAHISCTYGFVCLHSRTKLGVISFLNTYFTAVGP